MQDRFRFRVWKGLEHRMVYEVTYLNPLLLDPTINPENKHNILMQCTGMKDDNDKLIYEGDIVEIWRLAGNIQKKMVVKWRDSQYTCRLYDLDAMGATPQKLLSPEKRSMGAVNSIKILGNIYENPL